MRLRLGVIAALVVAAAGARRDRAAGRRLALSARRHLRRGADALRAGRPRRSRSLKQLHVQEMRLNLYWGGQYGVAKKRPADATEPERSGVRLVALRSHRRLRRADGIHVVFSIYGTPGWANGGKGTNVAPTNAVDLRTSRLAAAQRYTASSWGRTGRSIPPCAIGSRGTSRTTRSSSRLSTSARTASGSCRAPVDYARICNAIYSGVHSTLIANERVACGATAPRGNNNASSSRPSISPLAFLRAASKAGLKTFDAWAHHPYYPLLGDAQHAAAVAAERCRADGRSRWPTSAT